MNTRMWHALLLALLTALAVGGGSALLVPALAQAPQAAADMILTNGKIITVDPRFSIAQAVAIRGERIVAVGTNQEIARLAGPSTRRIDLRGRWSFRDSSTTTLTTWKRASCGRWAPPRQRRQPQTGAGDDSCEGELAEAWRVGVHARRLVARPVHRRQTAVDEGRAGQGGAEQSGAAAVHARGDLSEQPRRGCPRRRQAQGSVDQA